MRPGGTQPNPLCHGALIVPSTATSSTWCRKYCANSGSRQSCSVAELVIRRSTEFQKQPNSTSDGNQASVRISIQAGHPSIFVGKVKRPGEEPLCSKMQTLYVVILFGSGPLTTCVHIKPGLCSMQGRNRPMKKLNGDAQQFRVAESCFTTSFVSRLCCPPNIALCVLETSV